MRAKVVLFASIVALAVLVPAIYLHYKQPDQPVPATEPVASDNSTNTAPSPLPTILHCVATTDHAPDGVRVTANPAADLKAPNHQEYVAERKAELYQMGINRIPGSLGTILAEVHNADPAIREAAVSASMDFGSKDAISTLQNELTWAEDPQEKMEIQQAIDFLQLPPFEVDEHGNLSEQPAGQSPPNN